MAKSKSNAVDKLIDAYYTTLEDFTKQYALHEGAVSVASQSLLTHSDRNHHWTLPA